MSPRVTKPRKGGANVRPAHRLREIGREMHRLAVEIAELLGTALLHPYDDELLELCDLQIVAQALGNCLAECDAEAGLNAWLDHARSHLLEVKTATDEASR